VREKSLSMRSKNRAVGILLRRIRGDIVVSGSQQW